MKQTFITLLLCAVGFIASAQNHCKGIKKDGSPCKSVIINKDGYCQYHDPKALHCAFIKANGEHCKMIVKQGETLCRFHKK